MHKIEKIKEKKKFNAKERVVISNEYEDGPLLKASRGMDYIETAIKTTFYIR